MPRGTDNRDQVSALLNLSDGMLADFLRLQIISKCLTCRKCSGTGKDIYRNIRMSYSINIFFSIKLVYSIAWTIVSIP